MWGLSFRSVGGAGAGFLFGSILAWILPIMTPLMAVDGSEGDFLVEAFVTLSQNGTTVLLLSVFVGFVAGAVREGSLR
jgi:hypothetical protein